MLLETQLYGSIGLQHLSCKKQHTLQFETDGMEGNCCRQKEVKFIHDLKANSCKGLLCNCPGYSPESFYTTHLVVRPFPSSHWQDLISLLAAIMLKRYLETETKRE